MIARVIALTATLLGCAACSTTNDTALQAAPTSPGLGSSSTVPSTTVSSITVPTATPQTSSNQPTSSTRPVTATTAACRVPTAIDDDVRRGDCGQFVRQIQERLRQLGFDIAADGRFGPATDAAVRAFQRSAGVRVDGQVGRRTWAAMSAATLGD